VVVSVIYITVLVFWSHQMPPLATALSSNPLFFDSFDMNLSICEIIINYVFLVNLLLWIWSTP
jgi:hypothetical protein